MESGERYNMTIIPSDLREKLDTALRVGDSDQAEAVARQILENGIEPLALVQQALVPTLTDVGQKFQDFEIYLPELMMAGEAAERVTALLEEAMLKAGKESLSFGTIVLGQVEGDIHDIGRNILCILLKSHGFRVIDLGRDVAASAFLEAAQKEKADIVGLSALMTTALPAQKRTIHLFSEVGLRHQVKLIIGGGATNQTWADEIGADGYAPDAASAVDLCKRLLDQPSSI
ncbi:MAG: cobalamin-binding protein [Anaerolineales bacterium]|nr:cobalamin-binding protein [Anaerolineae bacterium]PWB53944.1 MAG: cobalamin-binding protein [Anaerolineales bacterium]